MRPTTLADFHGQSDVCANIAIAIASAKRQKKPLGHMLFTGDAGLGKTTLASEVIPNEMGSQVKNINCAALTRSQELTSSLSLLNEGDFVFLDEVHALPGFIREHLLTYMEDGKISLSLEGGDGPSVIEVELPKATVLAATTRQGNLDGPLRSRFMYTHRLQPYTVDELARICEWHLMHKTLTMCPAARAALAKAARGTARVLVNLLEATVDTYLAQEGTSEAGELEAEHVRQTLSRLGYTEHGDILLSPDELRYLTCFVQGADVRRSLGLKTLAAMLCESTQTIEEVYEPGLLRSGYLERTATGRQLTPPIIDVMKGIET